MSAAVIEYTIKGFLASGELLRYATRRFDLGNAIEFAKAAVKVDDLASVCVTDNEGLVVYAWDDEPETGIEFPHGEFNGWVI